jgi:hypothetical protein
MKETTLLNMKHDLNQVINAMQNVMNDLVMLRTISMGTLETIKLMPGYDEAIATLNEMDKAKSDLIDQNSADAKR